MHKLPNGFVYLSEVEPGIIQDIRYSTFNNFVGRPLAGYNANIAILQEATAIALKNAYVAFKKRGYDLVIFEAYRPQSAADDLYAWAHSDEPSTMRQDYYPKYDDRADIFKDGFIARYSMHTLGAAVDIGLMQNGVEIDMGTIFDFFGEKAHTDSANITVEQRNNRMILLDVMHANNFENYSKEWWHFNFLQSRFTRENTPVPFNFPID